MFTELTLHDVIDEHGRGRPDALAVVDGDRRFTYRELADRSTALAASMAGSGVTAGSRVLWLGVNSHHLVELMVAAGRLGAMVCPVNWRQSTSEIAFVLGDLDPALVVYEAGLAPVATELADGGTPWVRCDGTASDDYEVWLRSADAEPSLGDVTDSTPVLLMYTAAFDGRPNGAMLSHRSLIAHALVMTDVRQIDDTFRFLTTGPMFHIGTMMFVCATVLAGGVTVIMPQFDAEAACRLIESERCTGAMLFPVMIDQLVAANADRRHDLSSLRFAPNGTEWDSMTTTDSSPWGRSNAGYGQTEVGGMLTFHALGTGGAGSHGRASPLMQLRIVDVDDNDVPVGEVGEIATRGLHLFNGYFNRHALNEYRFRRGWYHTNDLGRREADGTITFIGPKVRMIKSGGENIYPADVERVLREHPLIADAAVIGVPDEKWGQSVSAIILVEKGSDLGAEEVVDHVRTHAASYKKPRSVVFVDRIPRRGFAVDYDLLDREHGGGGYVGEDAAQLGGSRKVTA